VQAGALVAWAALFVVGALYAYALTKRPEPIYLYGGVGAMLLGIATSIQFDGHTLTVAWTLEATVLAIGTLLMTRSARAAGHTTLAFFVPILSSTAFFTFYNTPHATDAAVLALISFTTLLTGGLLAVQWSEKSESTTASPVLALIGVLYAFMAAAAYWSGTDLSFAWILIAFAATVGAYAITQSRTVGRYVAFAFLFPAVHSMGSLVSSSWDTGIMHADALVVLLLATALMAAGILLREPRADASLVTASKGDADTGVVVMTFGSLYYYVLLWLAAPTLFGHQYAVMSCLVIYTLIGLFFYLTGRMQNHPERSVYGAGVLGFVVLRLLLVDVWQMELSGRIVTFLLIGTLLVATAFIGRAPKSTVPPAV